MNEKINKAIDAKTYWPDEFKNSLKAITSQVGLTQEKFDLLSKEWYAKTAHLSASHQRIKKPEFAELLSYGEELLPFVFRDLSAKNSNASLWSWLNILDILIEDKPPIPISAQGRHNKVLNIYLKWGREKGYEC